MNAEIPNCLALVDAVMSAATNPDSALHGPGHWKCVAWTGLRLIRDVPGADRPVVFLFGLIHDSMRLNDGHDPDHGRRAGLLARRLSGRAFHLDEPRPGDAPVRLRPPHLRHDQRRPDRRRLLGRRPAQPVAGRVQARTEVHVHRAGECKDVIEQARRLEAQHFEWADLFRAFKEESAHSL